MNDPKDACVSFRLGREGFGIPLDQVREIAAVGVVAPVPLAPAVVKGLANVRGQAITLIDVAEIFGRPLPSVRFKEDRLALILAAPHAHLGLYVHAPVAIGLAETGHIAYRAAAAPGMTAARALGQEEQRLDFTDLPAGGLAEVSGEIVHLLSARELVTYCDAKVLERFRRKS